MIFPLRPAGLLSMRGRKKKRAAASRMSKTATVSPVTNRTFAGKIFSVWKRKRKYHSGLIPSGAGAIRSAALPRVGGRNTAMVTNKPAKHRQRVASRKPKLGHKGIARRAPAL